MKAELAPRTITNSNKPDPQSIPHVLLKKNTTLFMGRILLALTIMSSAGFCMLSGSVLLFCIGTMILGAMYVHLIEFQHSVLHLQVFSSHRITRLVGFLLGLPMMISFSEFQYKHLRHHKYLGTALNTETFDYQRNRLNSPLGFALAALDYSRLISLTKSIYRAFSDQNVLMQVDAERNPFMEKRIRREYQLFGIILGAVVSQAILTGSYWLLAIWLAPLIVSEPVHFLLELPEHLGLPAHSNQSVFENTRSWGGSWFARWFTHYTNFHVAHHFNQLVPMDNLPELQKLLDSHIPESSRSASYPDFYRKVIRGEIVPDGIKPDPAPFVRTALCTTYDTGGSK